MLKKLKNIRDFHEHANTLMSPEVAHFVLSSSLEKDNCLTRHTQEYGDSVKKLSFWVNDAKACFDAAVAHGAKPTMDPQEKYAAHYAAAVEVFNNVEHEFLQVGYGSKIPGFEYAENSKRQDLMLFNIDHIATCHPSHTIHKWVEFYKDVFGFSESATSAISRLADYQSSKAALSMFTRSAALELSKYHIRVNTISPGLTRPSGNSEHWQKRPEVWQERTAHIPLGRAGEADDHIGAAIYLASDEAKWVTGADIVIDGGQSTI